MSTAATIEMKPPAKPSGNVHSLGYDAATKTLAVRFHIHDKEEPRVYHYSPVSREQFDALVNADSVGSHFHRHIRGKYQGTRIEGGAHPNDQPR